MNDENVDENATDKSRPLAPTAGATDDDPRSDAPSLRGGEELSSAVDGEDEIDEEFRAPRQLGAARYVLAFFFAAGIGVTFLVSKSLTAGWNRLADNAWVSQHATFMNRIAEDDRSTYTMLVGATVGVAVTVYAYRRDDLRTWTNEVAAELAKVSWPNKKEVTNSTVVVILASTFATIYLALLDKFWGFVTSLVYGS